MRNWLLVWIGLLSLGVYGREYFITKDQSDLVFDGRYLTEFHNKGKEFWVCVDYEAEGIIYPDKYGNHFPMQKCGGSPRTQQNMYWYAIHGIWEGEDKLSIRFKSKFQLWPEYNDTNPAGSFFWTWRQPSGDDNRFRVIQTHGITNYGQKRPDIDTLLLTGAGSVHVRGVKDGSKIHVRVKSETETGITLEQVLETVYDQGRNEFKPAESVSSEETVTDLPLYIEPETILPETKTTEEPFIEVVTSTPTEWTVVDSEPSVRRQEDEPVLLVQMPNLEEGVQSRPTENIPFAEPLYDNNFEEERRATQITNFENEITEEESNTMAPSTTETTNVNTVEDNSQEIKLLYDSLAEVQDSRREYDFQLLYTVLIGTALGFFCFFVLIVLFRCYVWGKTDKVVNSYSPQTQQKHIVYTIGGTLPIKIQTQ